jgi:YspA, cpYpsA-related SLOG family
MRILICGDRNWTDQTLIEVVLEGHYRRARLDRKQLVLIEGCARGADKVACEWGPNGLVGMTHEHFPAEWDKYGKSAGPIRNRQMADEGKPDIVYAFHDDLAGSRGTIDMVRVVKKAKIPLVIVSHG